MMYLRTSINYVFSPLVTFVLMSGCGGDGTFSGTITILDGDPAETMSTEVTGRFIDSPVEGLSYMCSSVDSKSGITNAAGEFTCYEGNTVTFKVGEVLLGSNLVSSVITPITLHPKDPQAALNVARLLQSLDDDEDLTTIKIDSSQSQGLDASLDVTADSFEEKANLMLTKGLVTREDAIAHLHSAINRVALSTILSADWMSFINDTFAQTEDGEVVAANDTQETGGSTPTQDSGESADDNATEETGGLGPIDVQDPDNTITDTSSQTQEDVIICATGGKAVHEGQVTDIDGQGIAGVKVSISGCEETTDSEGRYKFVNIVAMEDAVVDFQRDGFYRNSRHIDIHEPLSVTDRPTVNHLKTILEPYKYTWSFASSTGTSGGAVEISGSTFYTPDDKLYQGSVKASWIFHNMSTATGRDLVPGTFEGVRSDGETVPLVMYGFTVLALQDAAGQALHVSDTVTFHLSSATSAPLTGIDLQTISLWRYDYRHGRWMEEGYASRQPDGKYVATVSQPGTWCLAEPLTEVAGTYQGNVLYEDHTPAKGIRVYAIGDNWISSDLSTDEKGDFTLKVIPDSAFTLKVYDVIDGYEAGLEGTLAPIASGDTVG